MFRLFTARINAMFETTSSYIREKMFRLFTARINAMFENYIILVLDNKCFVFLRRA